MMDEKLKSISLLEDNTNNNIGKCLFTEKDTCYCIPLYQRAFAWTDKEINQLIEDIYYIEERENYYLGSLIVSRKEKNTNIFELIDGQQRLTALTLIFIYLGLPTNNILNFMCRDKSNYTMRFLEKYKIKDIEDLYKKIGENRENIDNAIIGGYDAIINRFKNEEEDKIKIVEEKFKNKLKNTIIYRIEVPENTDLNKYFEIMNTRGEQLEQQDILKAKLLNNISNPDEREKYAKFWEACSDMSGYVQMHFNTKDRKILFGNYWNELKIIDFLDLKEENKNHNRFEVNNNLGKEEVCIGNMIENSKDLLPEVESFNKESSVILRPRFESIISFPYFLLHTLKLYVHFEKKDLENKIEKLLDDKKLLETFNKILNKVNQEEFSKKFIKYLIECRYIFDKYFIKRDYQNEDENASDGVWSIQEISGTNGQASKKIPKYTKTKFVKEANIDINKKILMLESCLRVSYISSKVMHWITETIIYLYENKNTQLLDFDNFLETIIKHSVRENYLDLSDEEKFKMGVNTPHIVFNYIDYLLWKNNDKDSYEKFTFEFRNSVEHWYPQNPSGDTVIKAQKMNTEDGLNCLGNLCLLTREENSKFTNAPPTAKRHSWETKIKKGSIKLRKMSQIILESGDNADTEWKNEKCKKHNEDMIRLLIENIY